MCVSGIPINTELLNFLRITTGRIKEWVRVNSKVLDVGCGDGRIISDLLSITQNITAIDIDTEAIARVQSKFQEYPSIKVLHTSAQNMPFDDEAFDFVVCMGTFMNFSELIKDDVLTEMKRVTTSEGKIVISSFNENAMIERIKMYSRVGALDMIESIHGGTVTFDSSFGANTSTQYSLDEYRGMFQKVGLCIEKMVKIEIGYIFLLKKVS